MSRFAFKVVVAIAVTCSTGFAQAAQEVLLREVERLERVVQPLPDSDPEWKDVKPSVITMLQQARTDLAGSRLYRALELLAEAESNYIAMQTMKAETAKGKPDIPKFEAAWRESGNDLMRFDEEASKRDWRQTPAALRAIAESNQGRTITLLNASRAYATVTAPEYGFYYLGQAKASAAVSKLASGLPLRNSEESPNFRSIRPELQKLQNEVIEAFKPPRSIEKHPDFIRLNATLKLASELDEAKLYAGAVYQYLSATEQFAVMQAPEPDAAEQAKLKERVTNLRGALKAGLDTTLPQIFVERAESFVSSPSANTWKRTAAITNHVLPAYRAYLEAAPSLASTARRIINVTLVRWPYT